MLTGSIAISLRPKPCLSGKEGCAPTRTPFCFASCMVLFMILKSLTGMSNDKDALACITKRENRRQYWRNGSFSSEPRRQPRAWKLTWFNLLEGLQSCKGHIPATFRESDYSIVRCNSPHPCRSSRMLSTEDYLPL